MPPNHVCHVSIRSHLLQRGNFFDVTTVTLMFGNFSAFRFVSDQKCRFHDTVSRDRIFQTYNRLVHLERITGCYTLEHA